VKKINPNKIIKIVPKQNRGFLKNPCKIFNLISEIFLDNLEMFLTRKFKKLNLQTFYCLV
jgi:hypothetical protein